MATNGYTDTEAVWGVRSETVAITLTPDEKLLLKRLARNQGATIRGLIRKLIREAAAKELHD